MKTAGDMTPSTCGVRDHTRMRTVYGWGGMKTAGDMTPSTCGVRDHTRMRTVYGWGGMKTAGDMTPPRQVYMGPVGLLRSSSTRIGK